MTICLVDTSIFCNVLAVPGRSQDRALILDELAEKIQQGWNLLLPIAAIIETGNHIAQVGNGHHRRTAANRFVEQVRMALNGDAPWVVTPLPDKQVWLDWLGEFPDRAGAGVGIGDLTIIKEYDNQCALFPMRRVLIWSLDGDLQGYDRNPV